MSEYTIGSVLKEIVHQSKLTKGLRAVQIEEIWLQLMGVTIAKYTRKIEIIHQKLFIYSDVGPLKHELLFQKALIIERVNEAFGENVVNEVIIQ